MAPEILMKEGYGVEVDYWSIGVILFEALAGKLNTSIVDLRVSSICGKNE